MKKIKTSEATGAALDWLVAKCEDALHPLGNVLTEGRSLWLAIGGEAHTYMEEDVRYQPSVDWSQGGPIIEREEISIDRFGSYPLWEGLAPTQIRPVVGPTPLIAAMRCYVASKLGDEVEVPDELF